MKHVDLGIRDRKGRTVGAFIGIRRSGESFEGKVQAARGRSDFGARQPWRRFASSDAARAWLSRRLNAMTNRAHRDASLAAEGCHAKWTDRETGTTLTIRDAKDYEVDPTAGRYFLICEDHSSCVGVETKAIGRRTSAVEFCDDCRKNTEGVR